MAKKEHHTTVLIYFYSKRNIFLSQNRNKYKRKPTQFTLSINSPVPCPIIYHTTQILPYQYVYTTTCYHHQNWLRKCQSDILGVKDGACRSQWWLKRHCRSSGHNFEWWEYHLRVWLRESVIWTNCGKIIWTRITLSPLQETDVTVSVFFIIYGA